jgi:biopolymer transport protein ExbD
VKHPRKLKPFTGRLDLAPFAGVFFLLVLFLLLQSPLAPAPGLRLELPVVELPSPPASTGPTLVVTVDRNGLVYFEHQVIRDNDLRERLAAKVKLSRDPLALLVQADESVRQAVVVRLAGLARQAGIREIVIATRPPLFLAKPEAGTSP